MNKNHEQLINNLIPVMWDAGGMGAFFMRFIEDKNFGTTIGKSDNLEWLNFDRVAQYVDEENDFYQLHFNKHTSLLKEKYKGDDYHKAVIYVLYQLSEKLIDRYRERYDPRNVWLYEQLIIDLAESDPIFDISKLKFIHLKLHTPPDKSFVNALDWRSKIFCHFSRDKLWLTDILAYYKKSYYKTFNNSTINQSSDDPWNNVIKNIGNRRLSIYNEYVYIDMYDLIFNKNIDQLKRVYPDFKLTDAQNNLLDIAKKDIINICDVFGLDHTMSVTHDSPDKNILYTPQIIDILKRIQD